MGTGGDDLTNHDTEPLPLPDGVGGSAELRPGGGFLHRPGELLVGAADIDEVMGRLDSSGANPRREDGDVDERLDLVRVRVDGDIPELVDMLRTVDDRPVPHV